MDILLVSRHCHEEAKLAIAESRGNMYIDKSDTQAELALPQLIREAISVVQNERAVYGSDILNYRVRFPHLKTIRLGWLASNLPLSRYMAPSLSKSAYELLGKTSLERICRGEINDELREAFRRDLERSFGKALDSQTTIAGLRPICMDFDMGVYGLANGWRQEVPR